MFKRKVAGLCAAVLTLGLGFGIGGISYAGDGYRGNTVNGCRAYIQGRDAWTNCMPAKKTAPVSTKTWCTAQPIKYGAWQTVGKGKTVYNVSKARCVFSAHFAQTLVQ